MKLWACRGIKHTAKNDSLAWSLGGWRQPLTNMDELGRAQWFRQLRSVKDTSLAKTVELYSQGTLSEYPVFKPAAKELGKWSFLGQEARPKQRVSFIERSRGIILNNVIEFQGVEIWWSGQAVTQVSSPSGPLKFQQSLGAHCFNVLKSLMQGSKKSTGRMRWTNIFVNKVLLEHNCVDSFI